MNPVAVILSLIFWYWMWGVMGAVLAVPVLAIVKILCDRLRPFRAFGHILEGIAGCFPPVEFVARTVIGSSLGHSGEKSRAAINVTTFVVGGWEDDLLKL